MSRMTRLTNLLNYQIMHTLLAVLSSDLLPVTGEELALTFLTQQRTRRPVFPEVTSMSLIENSTIEF